MVSDLFFFLIATFTFQRSLSSTNPSLSKYSPPLKHSHLHLPHPLPLTLKPLCNKKINNIYIFKKVTEYVIKGVGIHIFIFVIDLKGGVGVFMVGVRFGECWECA